MFLPWKLHTSNCYSTQQLVCRDLSGAFLHGLFRTRSFTSRSALYNWVYAWYLFALGMTSTTSAYVLRNFRIDDLLSPLFANLLCILKHMVKHAMVQDSLQLSMIMQLNGVHFYIGQLIMSKVNRMSAKGGDEQTCACGRLETSMARNWRYSWVESWRNSGRIPGRGSAWGPLISTANAIRQTWPSYLLLHAMCAVQRQT